VILPKAERKEREGGPDEELRRGLTIHLVSTIDEVLLLALLPATRGGAAKAKAAPSRRAHAGLQ
jgi:ATP-dependent Lon protease